MSYAARDNDSKRGEDTEELHPMESQQTEGTSTNDDKEMLFSVMPEALRQNFGILKKRNVSAVEALRVAEETQAMVYTEVSRMQNAVAELEEYLQIVEERAGVLDNSSLESQIILDEDEEQHDVLVGGSEDDNSVDTGNDSAQKNLFLGPEVVVEKVLVP